jgi:hypothetical protein
MRLINSRIPLIKKPWDDDDDDADAALPADAVLPGRMRGLTNRQARVRMARADLLNEGAKSSNIQQKGTLAILQMLEFRFRKIKQTA